MTPTQELQELTTSMAAAGIKLKSKKDSWFRLGKTSTTTIGKTIFLTTSWDKFNDLTKLEILTHEMVHVGQYRKYTVPGFLFLYLLAFFPIGFAYFRYVMERRAYAVGFKKYLEHAPFARPALVKFGTEAMVGSGYGWAWPFRKSVRAWFERELKS